MIPRGSDRRRRWARILAVSVAATTLLTGVTD
jgi:hypothetical protein